MMPVRSTYFGYGSLVNRNTRDPSEKSTRATLKGWIRQWAHQANGPWEHATPNRSGAGVSALTVTPDDSASIDGVLVDIDESQLSLLDERESGYNRVAIGVEQFVTDHDFTNDTVFVYISTDIRNNWANNNYPLIHSYVDCVIAGFRKQYGEVGVERFMRSTQGWDLPLYDDRNSPLYPRAVNLTTDDLLWIDRQLSVHR